MLIERADFTGLDILAAHRQACWERQRVYVAACSPLHRRVYGKRELPLRLEDFAEAPLDRQGDAAREPAAASALR